MSESAPATLDPKTQAWLLGAACAVYLVLYVVFLPPLSAIEDEVGFLNQAIVWSQGATSAEGAGYDALGDFVLVNGRHVGWRNPGRSIVTVPFVWLGERGVFLSSVLIHLGLVLLCALCLARLRLPILGALLVLLHPTLALYSRAIMSDELAGVWLVAGFYGALRTERRGLWLGLGVGAAAWTRYHAGLLLPCVALALWLQPDRPERKRDALTCLLAGGAVGAALVVYNLLLLGHPLGLQGQGAFGAGFVGRNAAHYAVALLLLWPGMLIAPLLLRGPWRGVLLALTLPLLALLLPYYWFDQRPSWVETLVVGQRLLQPILPLWIVIYVWVLTERLGPRLDAWGVSARRAAAVVVVLGGSLGLGALFQRHQAHLRSMLAVREAVAAQVPAGSVLLANRTLSKLFEVPWSGSLRYRLRYYEYHGRLRVDPDIRAAPEARIYLGHLGRSDQPAAVVSQAVERLGAQRLEGTPPRLFLYSVPPAKVKR